MTQGIIGQIEFKKTSQGNDFVAVNIDDKIYRYFFKAKDEKEEFEKTFSEGDMVEFDTITKGEYENLASMKVLEKLKEVPKKEKYTKDEKIMFQSVFHSLCNYYHGSGRSITDIMDEAKELVENKLK